MLVVLYFHQLGYRPLDIALLFLFYEVFGVVTNLFGGWLAARLGLAATLITGLFLQVLALSLLLVDAAMLTVGYVMVAQAISGIAKDLNKLSAKSSVKLVAGASESQLYRWVAVLTGSKNALKGIGFFLGGVLLAAIGFKGAIGSMAITLLLIAIVTVFLVDKNLGKTRFKPKFNDLWSKSAKVNWLSAARLFLFGARDVWFVVALPVYLQDQLGWTSVAVGTLLACWILGYGLIQALTPVVTGTHPNRSPDGRTAVVWGFALSAVPALIVAALAFNLPTAITIVSGLLLFGAIFAVNSAVHSYLIVSYAQHDGVTLDIGFYYMSNAAGRLLGTVLSGWVYQAYGLEACLVVSSVFVALASIFSLALPRRV